MKEEQLRAPTLSEQLWDARRELQWVVEWVTDDIADEDGLRDFFKLMEPPIVFCRLKRFCMDDETGDLPDWWAELSGAIHRLETVEKQVLAEMRTNALP